MNEMYSDDEDYYNDITEQKTANDRGTEQKQTSDDCPIAPARNSLESPSHSSKSIPGLCGLMNVGNTCFINSVLQCMSNVPVITEYFLSEKHFMELNRTNPLGMGGEIAKAYGELIQKMWSGKYSDITPARFKFQVGRFNPSFSGFQQHDSQELLTFLLDGLHEDLNRIKKKPYIDMSDQTGKDDNVAAQEAWENYKKRNDSIIVDTFHGLLKSTVICPECEKTSVTFDPFCYLSLPLPYKFDRAITISYVPFDGKEKERMYRLTMARKDTIKELCRQVSLKANVPQNCIVVAEITKSHFHKFYGNEDFVDNISEKDINVFELPPASAESGETIVPVCFWEVCKSDDKFFSKHLFGKPCLITIPKRAMSFKELMKCLFEKLQRHFNFSEDRKEPPFQIYYMDSSKNCEPIKLEFESETCKLSELLAGNDPRCVRNVLLLQFKANERDFFYEEKPADIEDLINTLSIHNDKRKITIYDCLSLFTTCEKLSANDAWFCPKCKKHQRATKKFDLWKLPRVLIIHLKRFSYTRYRRDKIDAFVDFPKDNLKMDKYLITVDGAAKVYELAGICNHYGTMGAGHYTAYCKNNRTGDWYDFDDSYVSLVNPSQILTKEAYVLFYIAKDNSNNVAGK